MRLARQGNQAYPVGVVEVEEPALGLVNVLVAGIGAAYDESRVHVHIVAGEVECDEALEDDGPAGESGRQEDEQAGRSAAVRHHVEDSTEARRLLK